MEQNPIDTASSENIAPVDTSAAAKSPARPAVRNDASTYATGQLTSRLASRIGQFTRPAGRMDILATPSRQTSQLAQRLAYIQSPAAHLARRLDSIRNMRDREFGPSIDDLMRTPRSSYNFARSPSPNGLDEDEENVPPSPLALRLNAPSPLFPLAVDSVPAAPESPFGENETENVCVIRRALSAEETEAVAQVSTVSILKMPATPRTIATPKVTATPSTFSLATPSGLRLRPPVRHIAKNTVVKFVDEDGEEISRELLRPSVVIYTLQSAASLVKRGEIEAARAVFSMLELTSSRNAIYWITRAKFEEDAGNAGCVMALYTKAIKCGAEPIADIQAGVRWFLMRLQRQRLASPPSQRFASHLEQGAPSSSSPRTPAEKAAANALVTSEVHEAISQMSPGMHSSADEESVLTEGTVSPCPSPIPGRRRDEMESPMMTPRGKSRVGGNKVATPLRQMATRDVQQTEALVDRFMAALHIQKPEVKAEEVLGSFDSLETVAASRKQREELGASALVTPVRRSVRSAIRHGTPAAPPSLSKLLEDANYAYTPNTALRHSPASTPRTRSVRVMPKTPTVSAFSLDASSMAKEKEGEVVTPARVHKSAVKASAAKTEGEKAVHHVRFAPSPPKKNLELEVMPTPVRRSTRIAHMKETHGAETLDDIPEETVRGGKSHAR